MSNDEIIEILDLTAKLLELHGENDFKVRAYTVAVYNLDKTTEDLTQLSVNQLSLLQGVGKSIATKIDEIVHSGTLQEMQELLAKTPEGVVEMFGIKGIGPKKVRQIWQELNIVDTRELLLACENGEVAKLKGFGDKIQETIRTNILYAQSNANKLRMDKAEEIAQVLFDELEKLFPQTEIVGEIRLCPSAIYWR